MRKQRRHKVLLILEATLGGTGRHILDLAKGLLDRNNEVHLIYSPIRADVQFKQGLGKLRGECPNLRECELRIHRAVVPGDVVVLWRMFQYLRQHGPFDIIHGHSTKAGFLARLLPDSYDAAKLYTPHGLMTLDPQLKGLSRWAVCKLESLLAHLCTKVIVVSGGERQCALATGIPAEKLILIENGVDVARLGQFATKRADIRRSLGISNDSLCIGWVGRFCAQKNPARLLESFALINKKSAGRVQLVFIGSGALEPSLRVRAKELGVERQVVWAGPVDGAANMAAFDVLAHSSRTEAFSYVFLEAIAAGVPIVTTKVGVAEEMVERGGAGYVCDPWDPRTFADLLLRVLEDADLRASLSEAARRCSVRYDVANMLGRISDLYDSVVPSFADVESPDAARRAHSSR